MSPGKKGLGRGLSALFGDSKPSKKSQIGNLIKVAISDLKQKSVSTRQILMRKNLRN